jgi:ATP-dependent Zn protease
MIGYFPPLIASTKSTAYLIIISTFSFWHYHHSQNGEQEEVKLISISESYLYWVTKANYYKFPADMAADKETKVVTPLLFRLI